MSLAHNIFNTSLGRKYLMAFTGAGLFGFVVMHMLGNLTIFAGRQHQRVRCQASQQGLCSGWRELGCW